MSPNSVENIVTISLRISFLKLMPAFTITLVAFYWRSSGLIVHIHLKHLVLQLWTVGHTGGSNASATFCSSFKSFSMNKYHNELNNYYSVWLEECFTLYVQAIYLSCLGRLCFDRVSERTEKMAGMLVAVHSAFMSCLPEWVCALEPGRLSLTAPVSLCCRWERGINKLSTEIWPSKYGQGLLFSPLSPSTVETLTVLLYVPSPS